MYLKKIKFNFYFILSTTEFSLLQDHTINYQTCQGAGCIFPIVGGGLLYVVLSSQHLYISCQSSYMCSPHISSPACLYHLTVLTESLPNHHWRHRAPPPTPYTTTARRTNGTVRKKASKPERDLRTLRDCFGWFRIDTRKPGMLKKGCENTSCHETQKCK